MTYLILSVPSIFQGKLQPVRCWSSKPEVDGLPRVGRERSRAAADLVICYIASVRKLILESFLFLLRAAHSEYMI